MPRTIIAVLVAVGILVGTFIGVRFLINHQQGAQAGLKVTSTPTASIFLDSKNIGRSPYENRLDSGDYLVKLIPESGNNQTISWQNRVKLSPNLLTYINRELGTSELTSAGEVLTLEKTTDRLSEIVVKTTPDGATVSLDGVSRGTGGISLKNIEAGDHGLSFTAPGFLQRAIKVRTTNGYRLTVDIQLALQNAAATSKASGTPATGSAKITPRGTSGKTVKILDTPTGWLRVRSEPSTSASEAAKVNPGDSFTLLDEQDGWYKIEYEKGKNGWIASRFAQKSQ